LTSAFTGRPVRAGVAMTGEVTLRGRVLPVGGLREKLLAASRFEMHTVIVPHANELDIKEFIEEIDISLKIIYVKTMDEVLEHALLSTVVGEPLVKQSKPRKKKKKVAA
jgi:ATP-dependent Lon protease